MKRIDKAKARRTSAVSERRRTILLKEVESIAREMNRLSERLRKIGKTRPVFSDPDPAVNMPRAKLTRAQVRQLRRLAGTHKRTELAVQFGVSLAQAGRTVAWRRQTASVRSAWNTPA
jgi:hypothetical protein